MEQFIEPNMKGYYKNLGVDSAKAEGFMWIWPERPYPPIRTEMSSPFGKLIKTIHDLEFDVLIDDAYFRIPVGISVNPTPDIVENIILASDESWLKDVDDQNIEREYSLGKLWRVSSIENGQWHGIMRQYYDSGVLEKEEHYKHGKLHGIAKTYYPEGHLWVETPYRYGKIHGVSKQYYQDGQVSWEYTHVDGVKESHDRMYYQNGQLKSTMFVNSKQDGFRRNYFFENGQVNTKMNYFGAKPKFFNEDGTLQE